MIYRTADKNEQNMVIVNYMGKDMRRIVEKKLFNCFVTRFFPFSGTRGDSKYLKGTGACWAKETVNVAEVKI